MRAASTFGSAASSRVRSPPAPATSPSRPSQPKYTLFQDVARPLPAQLSHFDGVYGGIEYNQVLTDYVELGVHYDYSRTTDTSYREYTRPDESEIRQALRLRVAPLGVTVRLLPTGKRHKVVPFVGGGIDALFYQYEELRGLHLIPALGRRIPLRLRDRPRRTSSPTPRLSASTPWGACASTSTATSRSWARAGTSGGSDDMDDDFSPSEPGLVNTIDLSGWTFTVGVHVRF